MNKVASNGLSREIALLLVRGVKGHENTTLSGAKEVLDSLVAAGTIRESYVDAVKATLMIPDDPKIAKNMREWGEKLTNDMLRTWYGERAVTLYSQLKEDEAVDEEVFLIEASRVWATIKEAYNPANIQPVIEPPQMTSGSTFGP